MKPNFSRRPSKFCDSDAVCVLAAFCSRVDLIEKFVVFPPWFGRAFPGLVRSAITVSAATAAAAAATVRLRHEATNKGLEWSGVRSEERIRPPREEQWSAESQGEKVMRPVSH